jgi:hypothetical protein
MRTLTETFREYGSYTLNSAPIGADVTVTTEYVLVLCPLTDQRKWIPAEFIPVLEAWELPLG